MKPTEEQVQAIITDTANKLQAIIDDPCGGDYSDFECYEDDLGHCYSSGYHSTEERLKKSATTVCQALTPMVQIYTFSPSTMQISHFTTTTTPEIIGLHQLVVSR